MNLMAIPVFGASAFGTALLLFAYRQHILLCRHLGRSPQRFPWPPIAAFAVIDVALVVSMVWQ